MDQTRQKRKKLPVCDTAQAGPGPGERRLGQAAARSAVFPEGRRSCAAAGSGGSNPGSTEGPFPHGQQEGGQPLASEGARGTLRHGSPRPHGSSGTAKTLPSQSEERRAAEECCHWLAAVSIKANQAVRRYRGTKSLCVSSVQPSSEPAPSLELWKPGDSERDGCQPAWARVHMTRSG